MSTQTRFRAASFGARMRWSFLEGSGFGVGGGGSGFSLFDLGFDLPSN